MRLVLRVFGFPVFDLELTGDDEAEPGEDHEVVTTGHSSGFSIATALNPSVDYE